MFGLRFHASEVDLNIALGHSYVLWAVIQEDKRNLQKRRLVFPGGLTPCQLLVQVETASLNQRVPL